MSKVCSEYECFVKEKEKNPNISLKKKMVVRPQRRADLTYIPPHKTADTGTGTARIGRNCSIKKSAREPRFARIKPAAIDGDLFGLCFAMRLPSAEKRHRST